MPIKNILVLSYVHEGGEWFAIERLLKASKRQSKNIKLFLVGYTNGYKINTSFFENTIYVKSSKSQPPFSFFKNLLIDIRNIKKAIKKLSEDTYFDHFLITYLLMIFPIYLINLSWKNRIMFFFQGIKSVQENGHLVLDHRNIIISILEKDYTNNSTDYHDEISQSNRCNLY